MYKIEDIDSYISTLLIEEFKPNLLFILADNYTNEVQYVFSNPFEIIRKLWQEHVPYFEDAYTNSLFFLYGKAYELQYHLAYRYLHTLLDKTEDVTPANINNAAVLFLLQHSITNSNLLFGYVRVPEQTQILHKLLKTLNITNTDKIVSHIVTDADDDEAKTLTLREEMQI